MAGIAPAQAGGPLAGFEDLDDRTGVWANKRLTGDRSGSRNDRREGVEGPTPGLVRVGMTVSRSYREPASALLLTRFACFHPSPGWSEAVVWSRKSMTALTPTWLLTGGR